MDFGIWIYRVEGRLTRSLQSSSLFAHAPAAPQVGVADAEMEARVVVGIGVIAMAARRGVALIAVRRR